MPNATWQYGTQRCHRGPAQTGAERARSGRRRGELRQVRADVAAVGDHLTRARAAGQREAVARPDVDCRVDTLEVLMTRSILAGIDDEVVDLPGLGRDHIIES